MRSRAPRLFAVTAWSAWWFLGCGGSEATAVISAVDGAAVPRGELESTDVSVMSFDPPLGVKVILEFHDSTPCTSLTVDLCNLDDRGPFELGRGFLECDPESSVFVASKAAALHFSTGCPDGPWHHWQPTSGTVRLGGDDEVVQLSLNADMVPEFSDDVGTFSVRGRAEIDRADVDVVGD